jgi:hypothetical protein
VVGTSVSVSTALESAHLERIRTLCDVAVGPVLHQNVVEGLLRFRLRMESDAVRGLEAFGRRRNSRASHVPAVDDAFVAVVADVLHDHPHGELEVGASLSGGYVEGRVDVVLREALDHVQDIARLFGGAERLKSHQNVQATRKSRDKLLLRFFLGTNSFL